MVEKRFFQGFWGAVLVLGLFALAAQLLLAKVGELDLDSVIDRQRAAPPGSVLFSSAVNQQAFAYKTKLYDRVVPDVVAVGSSRAMQVRSQFFKGRFVNVGGASNNVAELEKVADHIAAGHHPGLVVLFVDQWWLNRRDPEASAPAQTPSFPRIVSADLLSQAAHALLRGNWIAQSFRSPNLGIYALLTDEGFSSDGSFYYLGTTTGVHAFHDVRFSATLSRIAEDRSRLQKASEPDPALVGRMCRVVGVFKRSAGHVVLVMPPFAGAVWDQMEKGGYEYMEKAAAALRRCSPDTPLFDFTNPQTIDGASDCEFVNGFHGGDVVYARMLRAIAGRDPAVAQRLDSAFVGSFIRDYAGAAAGMSLYQEPRRKEVDFLKLGCRKPRPVLHAVAKP
jgi:hypothetical protein